MLCYQFSLLSLPLKYWQYLKCLHARSMKRRLAIQYQHITVLDVTIDLKRRTASKNALLAYEGACTETPQKQDLHENQGSFHTNMTTTMPPYDTFSIERNFWQAILNKCTWRNIKLYLSNLIKRITKPFYQQSRYCWRILWKIYSS